MPKHRPLDLHVLGTPRAFVLSRDQTLRSNSPIADEYIVKRCSVTVQSRDHCTVHFGGFRSALTALTSHSSVVKVRLRFHAGSLLYRSGGSSVKTLLREFLLALALSPSLSRRSNRVASPSLTCNKRAVMSFHRRSLIPNGAAHAIPPAGVVAVRSTRAESQPE